MLELQMADGLTMPLASWVDVRRGLHRIHSAPRTGHQMCIGFGEETWLAPLGQMRPRESLPRHGTKRSGAGSVHKAIFALFHS